MRRTGFKWKDYNKRPLTTRVRRWITRFRREVVKRVDRLNVERVAANFRTIVKTTVTRLARTVDVKHALAALLVVIIIPLAIAVVVQAIKISNKNADAPPVFDTTTETTEVVRVAPVVAPPQLNATFSVQSGDIPGITLGTLSGDRAGAYNALVSMSKYIDPTRIRVGQNVSFSYSNQEDGPVLQSVSFPTADGRNVRALRMKDGSFVTDVTQEYRYTVQRVVSGIISSSLYEDGIKAGLPASTVMDTFDLFAYDVDFQRDIQPGDEFSVIYDRIYNDKHEAVSTGKILAASIRTGGRTIKSFRFVYNDNGDVDYFGEDGRGIRKALLLMPVQGGRLTNGFGARKNPLYGYSEFHPALDYGAPTGTPIMAAGDGVVTVRGWMAGGYGNYVALRHPNGYTTLYAHMLKFSGLAHEGTKVKQGQIIGYVGTTGMSTGHHLHYEVRHNGKAVNPATMIRGMPSGKALEGDTLERFKDMTIVLENKLYSQF